MSQDQAKKRTASSSLQKLDLIRKRHKFLRGDSDSDSGEKKALTKEQQRAQRLARQQYEALYKQYALVDLRRFEKGEVGCRWRIEEEVLKGKGEQICGQVKCQSQAKNVFEMNFGYKQDGVKKNALVKVSVCRECAFKLNYKKLLKKIS